MMSVGGETGHESDRTETMGYCRGIHLSPPLQETSRHARQPNRAWRPDDSEVFMLTFFTGLLLTAVIVVALYAFGVFNTPYSDAFRATFYLLLVMLILSVWFVIGNQPYEGHDASVGVAR